MARQQLDICIINYGVRYGGVFTPLPLGQGGRQLAGKRKFDDLD